MHPLIGHQQIFSFFEKALAADRLHHAYCFVGPHHVGRKRTAIEVAGMLFGSQNDRVAAHPNFLFVEREKDEDGGAAKTQVTIEQIHAVRRFVQLRSFDQNKKVVVIDDAERLNASAASALLKTLEEPGHETVVILIATDGDALPQTIRSRCHTMYFFRVSGEMIRSFLESQGTESEEAARMAVCSLGLPGRAIQWMEDPMLFQLYQEEVDRFLSLIGRPFFEKRKAIESFFAKDQSHADAEDQLRERFGLWKLLVRDCLFLEKGQTPRIVREKNWQGTFASATALCAYAAIRRAEAAIPHHVQPRLLAEHILLALP